MVHISLIKSLTTHYFISTKIQTIHHRAKRNCQKQRQIMQKFFKSGDFHASKIEYETALKNSGYKSVHFKYDLVYKNNSKRNRQRNIIVVSTNVAKRFLDLLDKYFRQNNQLHKIFNRNTVKVSYSYTPNVGSYTPNVGSSSSHTTKS